MTQPDPLFPTQLAYSLQLQQQQAPLVHCMTNDVVQTFIANVLLALQASPAMVIDSAEAAQFAGFADALLINVGTLTRDRRDAMLAAVQAGTPWTLDPVAVGALTLRTEFCQHLLSLRPATIRGNASEILALANEATGGRGVDSVHQADAALSAAPQLAQRCTTIVAVTGEVDYVTDGRQTLAIPGGSPLMTRVVGTGCALSAVVAACSSLPSERIQHVAAACWLMSLAGEQAARSVAGPGSFVAAFLDALWTLEVAA